MSARGSLGLAAGFSANNRRLEQQAKADEEKSYERGRQQHADERADETYQYQKGRRGLQDSLDQINLRNAQTAEQDRVAAHAKAAQQAQDEGFVDLIGNLKKGVSPAAAEADYNSRGTHKISGLRFANGRMQFADDGGQRDINPDEIMQVISARRNDSAAPPGKPIAVKEDEQLLDPVTHKPIFTGPAWGKEKKDKEAGTWVAGTDGVLYNNKTGLKQDGTPYGGKKAPAGAGAGDTAASALSRRNAMRKELGTLVGMKYDPETETILGGSAGDTARYGELTSEAERVMKQHPELGESQVASLVHQHLGKPKMSDAEYLAAAQEADPRRRLTGSAPDSWLTRAEPEDQWKTRLDTAVKGTKARDRQAAIDALNRDVEAAVKINSPQAEAMATQPSTSTAAPPARQTGRGAGAGAVIRPEQITGTDPNMVAAVQKSPSLLRLLTQKPATPGKLMGVKINGRMFYLAGTELRELPLQGQ